MSLYCATVLPLFERLWGYFLLHPQTQEFSLNLHSLADEADERLGLLGICNHIDLRLTSIQPFTSLYHETPDILFNFCLNTLYESSLVGTPNRI
jgi:hypothetical protein